jgi:hypothetical protein
MTLRSDAIPGFHNGISQQAPANRRPNQGELQENGLGTLVDGLMQRPGTEHLAVLTSNAVGGAFVHMINRDVDERYIIILTGVVAEPIEIYDLAGAKKTVQFGTLDEDNVFSVDNAHKAYAVPWTPTVLTNGTFDADASWNKGEGWTIASGAADCSGAQGGDTFLNQVAVTVGKTYLITFSITEYTAGEVTPQCGNTGTGVGTARSAVGTYQEMVVAEGNTVFYMKANSTFDGKIDNIVCQELDLDANPSEVFKAVTVADNTFIVNNRVTTLLTSAVNEDTVDSRVQTFAELPGAPADNDVVEITGDDVTGFDDWWVKYDDADDVWDETLKPGVSLGEFVDYSMPYRLVRMSDATFTFAPCVWQQRTIGDENSAPTPSLVNQTVSNVFFFKNRLGFLSEDNVVMSKTGDYFNMYSDTALDVLDSDPIDVSATSKQIEILRSVAIFDKSLILLADQQQFDFSSGDQGLTPTSVAITPTTRFNICQLCEPITAGPNVYFICPKTDFATVREYFIQPDSLLNDAADVTAHVPNYIPMGHIQLAACNSLDTLMVHSDSDPCCIYVYKYFWTGEEKAQSAWSKWIFDGEILGIGVINTIAYLVVKYDTEICLEKMEVENVNTGALDFRVYLDRLVDIQGSYDEETEITTFTLPYEIDTDEERMTIVAPATGRPLIGFDVEDATSLTISGDYSALTYHIGLGYTFRYRLSAWYLRDNQGQAKLVGRLQVRTLTLNFEDTGYFRLEVTPAGGSYRETMTHEFTGAIIGSSVLGDATLHSGEQRHLILSRNTEVQVDIVTDSYLPAAFQTGSWEGVYYPRGKE